MGSCRDSCEGEAKASLSSFFVGYARVKPLPPLPSPPPHWPVIFLSMDSFSSSREWTTPMGVHNDSGSVSGDIALVEPFLWVRKTTSCGPVLLSMLDS